MEAGDFQVLILVYFLLLKVAKRLLSVFTYVFGVHGTLLCHFVPVGVKRVPLLGQINISLEAGTRRERHCES